MAEEKCRENLGVGVWEKERASKQLQKTGTGKVAASKLKKSYTAIGKKNWCVYVCRFMRC